MATPHHTRARLREAAAVLAGALVAAVATAPLGLAGGLLAGWAALALVDVVWVLSVIWRMDAEQTRAHALIEDPGRPVARIVAVLGSVASLGAVAVVLLQTRDADELTAFVLAGVAVVAVASSWALIQVDYLLRYARLYYTPPEGGIDFNQSEAPVYTDFAYFSLGLGMTYQVADTNVTRGEVRRVVIAQTLLAYLFGAVILATVINLVTSLG
ncbi:MAG: DUF1345 domain-containing protein [Candidatus Microbacterium phytovorans]|uniref:DUF1345 domain-containing protein n=1 Tax=Candidatus Microbacterium phytovorans TaxID=3121374 RepID=A0AAJ6B4B0_9MICO|nr:DUF1345 domain-containing protein [Microbacterium sp.]WEK14718.1 MAG: DUF1345 domain-containing protein [Microbacterium sp.]